MTEYLYLENLEVGAIWTSPSRTVTETDVVFFAGMTGDYDPLHTDHDFAAKSHYGKPIAHGLLGMSLMAGLSSTTPRMRNLALTKVESWDFHRPIYVGDTLYVVNTIERITPRGRRSGEVLWHRQLMNSRNECVQSGRIVTIVARHTAAPRPPAPRPTTSLQSTASHSTSNPHQPHTEIMTARLSVDTMESADSPPPSKLS